MKIGKIDSTQGNDSNEQVVSFRDIEFYGEYYNDGTLFIALELFDDTFEDVGQINDLIKKYRDAALVYKAAYDGLVILKKKVKFNGK